MPTPVEQPQLIGRSDEVARLIGLDPGQFERPEFAEVFSGNRLLPGMDPIAMNYGGHQFGHWAGQLGDGRAIILGTTLDPSGQPWELQLKGAGPTPYSKTADGRAVLRSSLREFLCSEAMHHLGVPTTRALSLVLTGETVIRDMFYDGRPEAELGAVVCRVAPTFLRFGNYQLLAARNELQNLQQLVDFTIENYFPHLVAKGKERVVEWFAEVGRRTAEMLVHWMRVGFVHGVMNTDNMSILGLTIDYGPYGWLEGYDPGWTPNTTDAAERRYRFGNQPMVAHWNLFQLGQALVPLVGQPEPLQQVLESFLTQIQDGSHAMLASKLGWQQWCGESDEPLKEELFRVLISAEIDMTLFYRALAEVPVSEVEIAGSDALSDEQLLRIVQPAYYQESPPTGSSRQVMVSWLRNYQQRVAEDGTPDRDRATAMNQVNPIYVLRNYLAQLAIDRATGGDYDGIAELLQVLRQPYQPQAGCEKFAAKRPEWARTRPGCSMLSCSS